MTVEFIRSLYAYDTWANGRIFDTAALLTNQQFIDQSDSSFGSIRNTLMHLVYAQQLWLSRALRVELPPELSVKDYLDVDSLRQDWLTVDAATHEFVNTLNAQRLDEIVHYVNSKGEPNAYALWQILFHQANHAGQHRGEIAMVLTGFGHSPGWLDYLYFLDLQKVE